MLLTRAIALCSFSLFLLTACDPPAPAEPEDPPPQDEPTAGAGTTNPTPTPQAGASGGPQPTAGQTGGSAPVEPADASMPTDATTQDEDADTEHDAAAPLDPNTCPDGFPRGALSTTTRKLATLDPSPEGVGACANGDVFAGAAEKLWRIPLDGSDPELFATLPGRS